MIEFNLKDRRLRLIDGVFYARSINNKCEETKKEKWRKISFSKSHGYLRCGMTIDRQPSWVFQHRMVWYAHHQDWDIWDNSMDNQIDHKNNIRTDNRLVNLNVVTNGENQQNRDMNGCHFYKARNKWQAYINIDYKRKNLGYYDTYEEAHEAYLAEKRIHCPYFVENEEI